MCKCLGELSVLLLKGPQIITIMRRLVVPGFGYLIATIAYVCLTRFLVEEIPHNDANHAICHRPLHRLLRQYVRLTLQMSERC